jgi:hypothetical protein
METVYAADKNVTSFDVSWNRTTPWIVLMLRMSTSRDWTKLQHILSLAGRRIPQESAQTRQMPVQPLQNIPDSPDISLNDVSFTSMTVHMETVYAADKNVTGFDVSWIPHDGAIVPGFQCLHHWIGRSYNIYFLWLGENTAGISENSADASATTAENYP